MSEFDESSWSDSGFSREYIDKADIYVVERRRLFKVMKSFYSYFLKGVEKPRVLDLGSGDGIITEQLLNIDDSIIPTLVDGSQDMLEKAKERLKDFVNVNYIRASFQEILEGDFLEGDFDFVVSSLAIHHLELNEKRRLYEKIHGHLQSDGYFLNIDLVLAPVETLEDWYMSLWKEWINERKAALGFEGDIFEEILRRYKDNEDNRPDTLNDQLAMLKEVGYVNVDCHWKYGIFTIFGGRK